MDVGIPACWFGDGASEDINRADNDGRIPLHLAVEARRENNVRLLHRKGAGESITLMDNDGKTPLHLAVAAGEETSYFCPWCRRVIGMWVCYTFDLRIRWVIFRGSGCSRTICSKLQ
jgi:hypothetical protein